jgi:glucose-6-phosphate 1-epimerase
MQNIDSLNQQYAIPDHISFSVSVGGLIIANIHNRLAVAKIALQGAHLFAWQPHDESPVIWLSENARFETGKAIRGGIPLCWPWFGFHEQDPSQPAHGFVRTAMWGVSKTEALPDGSTHIVFTLSNNAPMPAIWPHAFKLDYSVTIGRELGLELRTENTGDQAFKVSEALHTYFAVGNIEQTVVHGLTGRHYADKTDGMKRKLESGAVRVQSEIDRIYFDTDGLCRIEDIGQQRSIEITSENSRSTTVWNPWQDKAGKMDDMGMQGYRYMVCVENGNALDNTVTIAPGQRHSLIARYAVKR